MGRETKCSFFYKKQKNFSEKQKGFRDGLSYSTPQKSGETRGNAITQPHAVPSHYKNVATAFSDYSHFLCGGNCKPLNHVLSLLYWTL